MKHLAAYLLLTLGGNTKPSANDIEKLLGTVGIDSDAERVQVLLKELEGKSVEEVIASGASKLASVPSGGAGAAAGGASAGAAAGGAPAEEAKKDEPEEEEESDEDMGFGLFD